MAFPERADDPPGVQLIWPYRLRSGSAWTSGTRTTTRPCRRAYLCFEALDYLVRRDAKLVGESEHPLDGGGVFAAFELADVGAAAFHVQPKAFLREFMLAA